MDDSPEDLEQAASAITDALPEGLTIKHIYLPEQKVANIKWLEINGLLDYDDGISDQLIHDLEQFFHQDSIAVMKKTKKGEQMFDCKPHIREMTMERFNAMQLKIHSYISAQNPTLNPNLLIKALPDKLKPDFSRFSRIEVYDEEMKIFR